MRDPSVAVDYLGVPRLLLHGFEHAARKEDSAFVIVGVFYAVLISCVEVIAEVVFVEDEKHLSAQ